MKIQILRAVVLLVSISAASVLVWNATRNKEDAERGSKDSFSSGEMQGSTKSKAVVDPGNLKFFEPDRVDASDLIESPKSGGIIEPEDISKIAESADPEPKVTDEEVKRTRDMMMSTSKSGRIMSDDKIREMLEKKAKFKAEMVVESKPHLMSSSKSGPAMTLDEFLRFMEAGQKASPKDDAEIHEILMHSSKSFSGPIFKPKDLEKIVEGDKKEDGLLPPQESDK